MSSLDRLHIFIMAGGSGERFWPLSRQEKPKHLLRLLGERTLLEETLLRVKGLVPEERIVVLTNEAQLASCREAVPWLAAEQFVAEPAKRDTAPAAALATALAYRRDPEAVIALFPADAAIDSAENFCHTVRDAVEAAVREQALGTIAVTPNSAATGFGYLQLGAALSELPGGSDGAHVDRFVEKPDQATAEQYLQAGNYAWNAGMFVWPAAVFLDECRRLAPALATFIEEFPDGDFQPFLQEKFAQLPKISVDFAIMEKAAKVISVAAGFGWDDVGTWTALPEHWGKNEAQNTLRGESVVVHGTNNIVLSTGRTVALCGVSDLVVVETGDAVLVCHRDAVQNIKELQPHLPEAVR
jgi:mannose-1-phosphate guanylyltransferase